MPLTIIHTSDWHLGRTLLGRRRHDHFAAFLEHLLEILTRERANVLLLAGDVFDTAGPGIPSQSLYYDFLSRLPGTGCRHAVITGGNHDSAAFLNAPAALLKTLHVQVIGSALDDPAAELLVLKNPDGRPELLVGAVPYLRERDLRSGLPGATPDEANAALLAGAAAHYRKVGEAAAAAQKQYGPLPFVLTGHLFAAGGRVSITGEARQLYLGTLLQFPAAIFPAADYVALGHLHRPQRVANQDHVRYSGSPLALDFEDGTIRHQVLKVELKSAGVPPKITEIALPEFQKLVKLAGSSAEILAKIDELARLDQPVWAAAELTAAGESLAGLRDQCRKHCAGTQVELLQTRSRKPETPELIPDDPETELGELDPLAVFECRLDAEPVAEELRPALRRTYAEALDEALHQREEQS